MEGGISPEEWATYVTATVAAFAGGTTYLRKFVRAASAAQAKLDQIARLSQELAPNGGTSLRDAVHRIECNMATIHAKMRMMFRHSQVDAFEANAYGEWLCVIGSLPERVGITAEQLLGFGWVNALHPEDQDRVFADWMKAIEQERDWICQFATRNRETGVTIEHRVHAQRVLRHGELVGYLGVIELDTSEEETL